MLGDQETSSPRQPTQGMDLDVNKFNPPVQSRRRAFFAGQANSRFNALSVSIISFTIIGLALVTFSPLALRALAAATHWLNWQQLSNIGQTYGAVSALLVGSYSRGMSAFW